MRKTSAVAIAAALAVLAVSTATSGCRREEPQVPSESITAEPAQGAEEAAPAEEDGGTPAVPVVPRVESGAIKIDGVADEWVGLEVPLYALIPPRPVEGEPKDRHEEMMLQSWAGRARSAEAQAMALAHDGQDLYVILKLAIGIQEEWEQTHRTGALGYLCFDSDGDASTGEAANVHGEQVGADFRLWLPTGFHGGTDIETVPVASYDLEAWQQESYEDVADGERGTLEDPDWIAFAGRFLEMRIPLAQLGLEPPAEVCLYFDHMGLAGEGPAVRLRIE